MRQILCKQHNQHARQSQIPQCHPFERPTRHPRNRRFPADPVCDSQPGRIEARPARLVSRSDLSAPSNRRFVSSKTSSLPAIHLGLPAFTCKFSASRMRIAASAFPQLSRRAAPASTMSGCLCVGSSFLSQCCIGHPHITASRASSSREFTATGLPTASNIHRSSALSPYA